MKQLLNRILRFVFRPVAKRYAKRNGTTSTAPRVELPNEVLLGLARDMIRQGHTVTIHVKGFSMRPFLEHQRDKVLLEAAGELHVGDAVLAEITPGHYVLHRIISMNGEELVLQGDGNVRGVEHCTVADVAGVVTRYIRPNRTIDAGDRHLCRRVRLWGELRPVRRYLLFVYKAIAVK